MERIYSQFQLEGHVISCTKYGNGHINETYLVVTNQPHLYILQKLNGYVFPNLKGLMTIVIAVTEHLRRNAPDLQRVLTLIPAQDGTPYLMEETGECWRMYDFVLGSVCLEKAESEEDFRQSGIAFGQFQNLLADFPAETLVETIPHFHDTPDRYRQLHEAIQEDRAGRLASVSAEVTAYLAHEEEAATLMNLHRSGKLPLRVTHNDTKLNNVMLDDVHHQPLCVIDLDTVMPGLVANDFGDSIRFGASTAAEDEKDLSKVSMSLALFEAYTEGFLSACGDRLTKLEKETLPMGAKLMTLECGARFLADYLNGDVYFRTSRPEHNLDRCRTQLKLVQDMETKWDAMQQVIRKYC